MVKYQYHKKGRGNRSLCGNYSYRIDLIDDWNKISCPKCLSLRKKKG